MIATRRRRDDEEAEGHAHLRVNFSDRILPSLILSTIFVDGKGRERELVSFCANSEKFQVEWQQQEYPRDF